MNFAESLAHGALLTIQLTVYAGVLGFVIALVAGPAMLSRIRVARLLARTYTEVFRGASELVILFIAIYTVPGLLGIQTDLFWTSVVALGINIGAYEAEVVRGAVQAVPAGQTEAAIALNMSPLLRLRHIIIPQAAASAIPPINVLTIQLLKGTALVSIVGLDDFTFSAEKIIELNGEHTKYFGIILIGYYVMAFIINRIFGLLERYTSRYRVGTGTVRA